MDEIKNKTAKKRKKKKSTNPAVKALKIFGTVLLSVFLIIIITCSIFATVLTIYVLNFADTTTTVSLDKTETSNISRFLSENPDYSITAATPTTMTRTMRILRNMSFITL